MRLTLLVIAGTLAMTTRAARAEEWYGWKTYIADASAGTMIATGWDRDNSNLILAGVLTYLVVPPIIHGSERRGTRALESVGARAGIPLLFGVVALGQMFGPDGGPVNPEWWPVMAAIVVSIVDGMTASTPTETTAALVRVGGRF